MLVFDSFDFPVSDSGSTDRWERQTVPPSAAALVKALKLDP